MTMDIHSKTDERITALEERVCDEALVNGGEL